MGDSLRELFNLMSLLTWTMMDDYHLATQCA